jgi:hypothetical protein
MPLQGLFCTYASGVFPRLSLTKQVKFDTPSPPLTFLPRLEPQEPSIAMKC